MTAGGLANGPDHDIPAGLNFFIHSGDLPAGQGVGWRWVDQAGGVFTTDAGPKRFRYTVADGCYKIELVE